MLSMHSDRLRSLGQMAAGIAHELNQPLSGVRGLAEHLLIAMNRGWRIPPEKQREKLALIIEQADRMIHIVNHVRLFAKEAGRPEKRPVNLNDVVNSCMDILGRQFRGQGVKLALELEDALDKAFVNPFSIEEVLINLMTNARDAVEERMGKEADFSPEVRIRTWQDRKDPNTPLKIQVIDNGAGIAPETLPMVFDPFFTTKGPDRGTGLGLSICKSIVEQFGGAIEIESEPGHGTTATISLPGNLS